MTGSGPYAERVRMRAMIATIDRDIARLPKAAGGDGPETALATSWAALVALLDVGPEPDLVQCPHCGNDVMRVATRCRDCWRKLMPPAEASAVASAE